METTRDYGSDQDVPVQDMGLYGRVFRPSEPGYARGPLFPWEGSECRGRGVKTCQVHDPTTASGTVVSPDRSKAPRET